MRDDLATVLRAAIEGLVERAQRGGLREVPLDEFSYSWLEKSGAVMELRSGRESELTLESFFLAMAPNRELIPEIEMIKPVTIAFERAQGLMSLFLASPGNLLRHYFLQTNRQLIIDVSAIYRTVDSYIDALTAKPFSLVTTLLLTKFSSSAPFEVNGIPFRPIEPSDFRSLGREAEWARSSVLPKLPYPASSDWIATIVQQVPGQGYGTPVEMVERMVKAIGLSVPGRSKIYIAATEFSNEFLRMGRSFKAAPYVTSRFGQTISVATSDVPQISKLYMQLAEVASKPAERYLGVALRRLEASATRLSDEDCLVDFVIGLESLLAPDSPNIEVTFRFRLRGAAILGSEFGSAKERLAFLAQLYAARSTAVHGGTVSNLADLAARAEKALKMVVHWFVDHPDRAKGAKHIVSGVDAAMAATFSA